MEIQRTRVISGILHAFQEPYAFEESAESHVLITIIGEGLASNERGPEGRRGVESIHVQDCDVKDPGMLQWSNGNLHQEESAITRQIIAS